MASAEAKIKIGAKDSTKKGIASAQKGVGKLTSAVKSYGAELAAIYLVVRKLIKSISETTKAWGIQEQAIIELNDALRVTGKFTPKVSEELQQLAKDLQSVTTYGDEATLSAMAMLQSLADLSSEGLKEITPLIQDLAAGMKLDLNMAASLVGKTLGSTTNALSRYGIVIDMTGTKAERLTELQDQINEKFGSRAKAMAEGYTGQMEQLSNQYGDLKEAIGELIADGGAMEGYIALAFDIIKQLDTWIRRLNELCDATSAFQKAVRDMNKQELTNQIRLNDLRLDQLAAEILELEGVIDSTTFLNKKHREAKKQLEVLNEEWWELVKSNKAARDQLDVLAKDALPKVEESLDDLLDAQKKEEEWLKYLAEAERAYKESLHLTGDALRRYIEECDSAREGTEYLRGATEDVIEETDEYYESIKDVINLMIAYSNRMYDMGTADDLYLPYVVEVTEKTKEQKEGMEDIIALMIEYSIRMYDMREANALYIETVEEAAKKTLDFSFELQDAFDIADMAYDTMGKGVSQFYANESIEAKNWYKQQKDMIENSIMDEEAKADALAALDEEMAAKESAIRTKEAQAQKKMALFGIVINTARGIAESFPAFWKMAAIAAAGIAQAAIVNSATIPTYQEGGVVPGYGGGDTVPALLEPGEMVIRKEIVREAQQGGGGEEVVFHIYNNIDGYRLNEYITRASRNKEIKTYRKAIVDV